jgi:hypothetical protein
MRYAVCGMQYADTYIPAQPLEHLSRRVPQGSYYPLHRILVVRATLLFPMHQLPTASPPISYLQLPYRSATYLAYASATYSYYWQNIILHFHLFKKKKFIIFFKITHLHHILVVTPGKQGQAHTACSGVSSERRAVYRFLQRRLVSRGAVGFSSVSRGVARERRAVYRPLPPSAARFS